MLARIGPRWHSRVPRELPVPALQRPTGPTRGGACFTLTRASPPPLQEGESFVTEECSHSCLCKGNGTGLVCVALSCSPEEVCRVQGGLWGCHPARTATCHVYGDPHYSTFDGRLLHFQGACNYTLAQACGLSPATFSITARNEHRGSPRWTALNSVAVALKDLHIALRKGRAVYVSLAAELAPWCGCWPIPSRWRRPE